MFHNKTIVNLLLFLELAGQACLVRAADNDNKGQAKIEFDSQFLNNGMGKAIDVTRFALGNTYAPGTYKVDLFVEDVRLGQYDIPFTTSPDDATPQPCFSQEILRSAGLDFNRLDQETRYSISRQQCVRITAIAAEAGADVDFGKQKVTLSIPQALRQNRARGYVDPAQWESGITVGMLNYNANIYRSSGPSNSTTQGYLGLNGGINIGNWHFRNNGSYNWTSGSSSQYQSIAKFVQRDIPGLSSQLTIGDTYTSGELFDAIAFRGIRLESDDRMQPDSLRGYAPTVRGFANSNAKVTIKQNNVTIYEITVPPGAFEISDLYASSYGGDLVASVREADGSVHSFIVPYSALPGALRMGTSRYSLTAGTVSNQFSSYHPAFLQGAVQYGLTDFVTGNMGITVAKEYLAATVGSVLNTSIGSIGGDITQTKTSIPNTNASYGSSARVSFAKSLTATGTGITIAAARYSTNGYFGLSEATAMQDMARGNIPADTSFHKKRELSLSLSQNLPDNLGQFSLTASNFSYWNQDNPNVSYNANYSNNIGRVSFSLSASFQHSNDGRTDSRYYLTLSIPLGTERPTSSTTTFMRDRNGASNLQSTLSGTAGNDNALSYGVTASRNIGSTSASQGSTNLNYRGSIAEFGGSASISSAYRQFSLSARGGIVAYQNGIAFSQPLSETFGIVEAIGAEGASVTNASGVNIGKNGVAVVPFLSPYVMNNVALDPKGTPLDVELKETNKYVAPRAGAVPLLQFPTEIGKTVLIRAHLPDATPLPFGALVNDETGKNVGAVGQAGKILARLQHDKGKLMVQWEGKACSFPYTLPATAPQGAGAMMYLQQITVTCDQGRS